MRALTMKTVYIHMGLLEVYVETPSITNKKAAFDFEVSNQSVNLWCYGTYVCLSAPNWTVGVAHAMVHRFRNRKSREHVDLQEGPGPHQPDA